MPDSQQSSPTLDQGAGTKKRIKRRPKRAAGIDNLGITLEPLFPQRRGGTVQRFAAAQILLEQEYVRALEGDAAAINGIYWKERANHAIRARQACSYSSYDDPVELAARKRRAANLRLVTEAMLLLRVAVVDADNHGEATTQPRRRWRWPVHLVDWAMDAGVDHMLGGRLPSPWATYQMDKALASRSTCLVEDDPLRDAALKDLRLAREAGSTRFKKGTSGNPRGRPRKVLPEMRPFPFLDEVVIMTVNGQRREMTRVQVLFYHLSTKAMKGDRRLARVLERVMKKHHEAAWFEPVVILDSDTGLPMEPSNYAYDYERPPVFASMRALCICSRRAEHTVRLEPWFMQLALDRLEPNALTRDEQKIVAAVACHPEKVCWPEWWGV